MVERLRPETRTGSSGKRDKRGRKPVRKGVGTAKESRPATAGGAASALRVVGTFLRATREMQKLTQRQLAAQTKGLPGGPISRTTISSIERGETEPTLTATIVLARALNVKAVEVMERADLAATLPVDLTGLTREELRRRAEDLFWAGDHRGALAVCDLMLEHLALDPPADPVERLRIQAKIEIDRALATRHCGALGSAEASAKRAIDLTDELPDLQTEAYMVLASILSQTGHHPLARDAAERAATLCAGCKNPTLQAQVWSQQGSVLSRSKRLREAHQAYLKARELLAQTEDKHHLPQIEGSIGICLMEMRKPKQARKQLVRAIDLARKHGVPAIQATCLAALGHLAYSEGRLDEGETHARAALAIAKPLGHVITVFWAELLRHRIVRKRDAADPDRHRVAYLKKLYYQIEELEGIAEVQEFKERYIDPETKRRTSP